MIYTSVDNKVIKDIKKLNDKKYRDLNNLFLVEGEHSILEAHKKGLLETLILKEGSEYSVDCKTIYVSDKVLNYISNVNTPTMIGVCKKIDNNTIGDRVLILNDIQDPGNLGTIIRSCVAFNIDTLILSKNSVDPYNSKVLRATQGMIFNINIIECDIKEMINNLKLDGYMIYGTNVKNGKSIKSIEKRKKFAIIMGNEGRGVDSSILDLCDEYIYISMNNKCESLNVAVATSIILYELDK